MNASLNIKEQSRYNLHRKIHKSYLKSCQSDEIIGFEGYLQEIDTLISHEDYKTEAGEAENLPILITGDPGSGKSSLISHWIQSHKSSHKLDNDFFIVRFSRITPNDTSYEFLLYSIYNELRVIKNQEFYHLPQKVNTIEDHLRINFKLWMEMANLKQQSSQVFRKFIIIVIDSVDKLKESTGREELPEWLPSDLPDNIRVIISCNRNSRCFNYLSNKVKQQVFISGLDNEKKIEVIEKYLRRVSRNKNEINQLKKFVFQSKSCENPLFLNLVLHFSLIKNKNFPSLPLESIKKCEDIEGLFEVIVQFFIDQTPQRSIVLKVLGYLAISRCGLGIDDLKSLCSHSESVIQVLEVFSICFFTCESLFLFKSDIFSKVIISRFILQLSHLRFDILEHFSLRKVSIKSVQERIYHYKELKEWLSLKDCLTSLEVFFIMYSPQNRLELIRCWNLLFEHHFDPVQEYNKTLEHFVEQHNPSNQEIFIILVQLCRFFKEFSIFEPASICEFRHPPLKKVNEVKELTLYEEIMLLPGLINTTIINPLRKDEQITFENKKAWNFLKDSVIRNDEEEQNQSFSRAMMRKKMKKELFCYKRWIWIQFPWCSLDVYSDFSQIVGVFNAVELNHQHDNEMAVTTLKIIRDARLKARKRFVPSKKSRSSANLQQDFQDRSVSAFVKAAGIWHDSLPPLNTTIQLNPINESFLGKQMTRGASSENINKKCKIDFNFDLMFKELTPANVLLKVGAKVSDYSNFEILKKKKENNELQTCFNKLVNETRTRTLQLESLKSQIAKSEDKMKESKEISEKIEFMKKRMEKIYEKINKAEVESKRLETIISCCFKNSARNELWEKGLEKGIQNINTLIESEKAEIRIFEEEKETLDTQITEFEKWFQDKIKIQENTLDRVVEQFSFKASIKETLLSGESKRANLINVQHPPRSESFFLGRLKERQATLKKIQKLKQVLEEKILNFEKIIQKLQTVASISSPQDLTSIIWQLERKDDLSASRSKLDDKLKDLKGQKDALEVKLAFLRQKESKSYNSELNPDDLNHEILENEKKITNLAEGVKRQELTYYACEGILQHILHMLGVLDRKISKSNHSEIFKIIGDRVLSMARFNGRPLLNHSHTLKVSTLQVPYSNKFNFEDFTPGSSALINSPVLGKSDRRIPENVQKIVKRPILKLPK
jgi:hypothetical protein